MINVSLAGIGGQGSVLAAKILAEAAVQRAGRCVRLKPRAWHSVVATL